MTAPVEIVTRSLECHVVADGLKFPEGPIALPDGTVLLVEIARGTLSRIDARTGEVSVVAECGGGPNGAAIGPDGNAYICNNGGYFTYVEAGGRLLPDVNQRNYEGGSIQRVDLGSGAVDTVYDSCDGIPLVAPNDLVFDRAGGFWFSDIGAGWQPGSGLLYATPDGRRIASRDAGVTSANGVGLSPDGTCLYVAETMTGTLWRYPVIAAGELEPAPTSADHRGAKLLYDSPTGPLLESLAQHLRYQGSKAQLFDSLAVDGEGWVCLATIGADGGITSLSPDGSQVEFVPLRDPVVTNICFAGTGHDCAEHRTAYVTCSATGTLMRLRWPRRGLPLAF